MPDMQREIEHSCGLQGFDPNFDVCERHEYERLLKEGYSEEDAAEIAKLKYLSSGKPYESSPIDDYFREMLRAKLESIDG